MHSSFYTDRSMKLIPVSSARAASDRKQAGMILYCLLSHNFSPCSVCTSCSLNEVTPLLPPLSLSLFSLVRFPLHLPIPRFFRWVLSPLPPASFCPFFECLPPPPPSLQPPAASQTAAQSRQKGSQTQPANDGVPKVLRVANGKPRGQHVYQIRTDIQIKWVGPKELGATRSHSYFEWVKVNLSVGTDLGSGLKCPHYL